MNSAVTTWSSSLGLQAVGEARAKAVDVAPLEGTWVTWVTWARAVGSQHLGVSENRENP